jgi:poly-gamma-glutamate synthesis protein (capsule biosynthesis protein)
VTTITAVGDIMLGDSATTVGFGLHSRYEGMRASECLSALAPLLHASDLAIGNLECVLTAEGIGRTRLARDQMRGDPAYARVLWESGFRALGVANNHATQHGRDAFDETVYHLESAGIVCFGLRGRDGWASTPAVVRLPGGHSVGILGYCWRPRQYGAEEPPFAEGTPAEVLADVSRLRGSVDHLVLSMHWGEEFLAEPAAAEVAFAHSAVAAGADLLLGHHPHVLRPVEKVGGAVVAYSLGNAVSDMLWMEPLRRGGLLECDLQPGTASARLHRLRTDDDYRARLAGGVEEVVSSGRSGLAEDEYRRRVAVTTWDQRVASYRYTARHVAKFPPRVGVELLATTLMNKFGIMTSRGER